MALEKKSPLTSPLLFPPLPSYY